MTTDRYFQRQLLPPVYRLNGVVDAIRSEVILNEGGLFGSDMRLYELSEVESIDIDTEMDFALCELLLKYKPDMIRNSG